MVLLAAVAEPLVRLLLTEKWMAAVPLYEKGRSDLFFRLEIIKKVIVFPLLLLAIPRGVMAICLVPVVHELVDLFLGTYCVRHLLGFRAARPLQGYGVYMPLALLACLPAFLICRTGLSLWLSLPAAAITSTALYLAMLWKDESKQELIKIVWEEIRRKKHRNEDPCYGDTK